MLLFSLTISQINYAKAKHWNRLPILSPSPSISLYLFSLFLVNLFSCRSTIHTMCYRNEINDYIVRSMIYCCARFFPTQFDLCEFLLLLVSFQYGFLWFFKCKRTWKLAKMIYIKGHFLYLFVLWVVFSSFKILKS